MSNHPFRFGASLFKVGIIAGDRRAARSGGLTG
jgi:hypothetical protein